MYYLLLRDSINNDAQAVVTATTSIVGINVTAITIGTTGNSIATTRSPTGRFNFHWNSATLTGGLDGSNIGNGSNPVTSIYVNNVLPTTNFVLDNTGRWVTINGLDVLLNATSEMQFITDDGGGNISSVTIDSSVAINSTGSIVLAGTTGVFLNSSSLTIGNVTYITSGHQIITSNVTNIELLTIGAASQGAISGYVYTTNGSGIASWQAPTGGTGVTSVSGTLNRITSTGGATPVIDISAGYIGQDSITKVGTISIGTWSADTIAILHGGTGQTTAISAFNALSPLTTLGDVLYNDGTNDVRLAGNTQATQKFLSQSGTGSVSQAPSWQTVPSAGLATYFFYKTASDIGGYFKMLVTASIGAPQTFVSGSLANGTNTILVSFATDPGFPNLTFIPPGVVTSYVTANQSTSGGETIQLFAEFYTRTSGGTETLISTTGLSSVLNTSATAYIFQGTIPTGIIVNATDRIVTKVRALTGSSGATHTVTLTVEDNTSSRAELPAATVDATNFIPYSGAPNNVDLNAKTISNVASYNKIIITEPATTATLTLANNSFFVTVGAFSTTITITATTSVTFPVSGILYGTAASSISSAQMLASMSDPTGTGLSVFGTSPSITTPTLLLANTSPTVNGSIGYDQTNKKLVIGDGSVSQLLLLGAWISTFTTTYSGFSANPTSITTRYIIIGKLVIMQVSATAGTSNATTFTITLPFAAANTAIQTSSGIGTNNGSSIGASVQTRVNSTTADVVTNTGAAWTNSGGKNWAGMVIYEMA